MNESSDFWKILIPSLASAGGGVATQLLERQRTEIKQTCGSRPWFGEEKKKVYNECVRSVIDSRGYNFELTKEGLQLEKEKALIMQKTVLYIVGGIIVVAILYFVVKNIFS